jgi:hypothetical protein
MTQPLLWSSFLVRAPAAAQLYAAHPARAAVLRSAKCQGDMTGIQHVHGGGALGAGWRLQATLSCGHSACHASSPSQEQRTRQAVQVAAYARLQLRSSHPAYMQGFVVVKCDDYMLCADGTGRRCLLDPAQ